MKKEAREHYFKGAWTAIENAKALAKVADSAIELEEPGVARSLFILSAEEAIKAAFIVVYTFRKEDSGSHDLRTIYRRHDKKHDFLVFACNMMEKHSKEIEERFNYGKYERRDEISEEDFIQILLTVPNQQSEYKWYLKHKTKGFSLDEAVAWFEEANREKNKGLYVDEIDGKKDWHNPRNYTVKDARKALHFTYIIIEYLEKFTKDCERPAFWNEILSQPED